VRVREQRAVPHDLSRCRPFHGSYCRSSARPRGPRCSKRTFGSAAS
jgi:hypothetical protein